MQYIPNTAMIINVDVNINEMKIYQAGIHKSKLRTKGIWIPIWDMYFKLARDRKVQSFQWKWIKIQHCSNLVAMTMQKSEGKDQMLKIISKIQKMKQGGGGGGGVSFIGHKEIH